jgi:hypothetical protein
MWVVKRKGFDELYASMTSVRPSDRRTKKSCFWPSTLCIPSYKTYFPFTHYGCYTWNQDRPVPPPPRHPPQCNKSLSPSLLFARVGSRLESNSSNNTHRHTLAICYYCGWDHEPKQEAGTRSRASGVAANPFGDKATHTRQRWGREPTPWWWWCLLGRTPVRLLGAWEGEVIFFFSILLTHES